VTTARATLDAAASEDDLLLAIIEAATLFGWKAHHIRRSDKALQQGHAGFPDLVLCRAGRLRMYELKSEKGTLTEGQLAWRLEMPPDSYWFEWRLIYPSDLDDVLASLR
jgi:hypothetical protein